MNYDITRECKGYLAGSKGQSKQCSLAGLLDDSLFTHVHQSMCDSGACRFTPLLLCLESAYSSHNIPAVSMRSII